MIPSAQDWLFSFKTFAAAMLALYVALWAGLPNPYWALGSVYVASQVYSGETASKAFYRLTGTVAGALASVLLVPNLSNSPVLLTGAIAVWIAVCVYFATLDRTPRSYAYALAAITTAIISFPAVETPDAIFDLAVAGTEEILIGIVSAAMMSALVLPRTIGPALSERIETWMAETRRLASIALKGPSEIGDLHRASLRHAAEAIALEGRYHHLSFEPGQRSRSEAANALRTHGLIALPIFSSIRDRIQVLQARNALSLAIARAVETIEKWLMQADQPHAQQSVRARLAEASNSLAISTDWDELLAYNLAEQLEAYVDLREGALATLDQFAHGRARKVEAGLFTRDDYATRHRDHLVAVLSAISAAVSLSVVSTFWILSGWSDGSAAALMAAVVCCLFSTVDDPVPMISVFVKASTLGVIAAAIYLFAVLPAATNFEMLALAFAPALLICGLLVARPDTALYGMAAALIGATALALNDTYTADFVVFANGNLAILLGMGAGAIGTALMRSLDAHWTTDRLVRHNRSSIEHLSSECSDYRPMRFVVLMLDRLGLLGSRLERMDHQPHDASRLMAEVNVGAALGRLRALDYRRSAPLQRAVRQLRASIGENYRDGSANPDPALLPEIDQALALCIDQRNDVVGRKALSSLLEIRRGLFPESWPPEVSLRQESSCQ